MSDIQLLPEIRNLCDNMVFINHPDFQAAMDAVSLELRTQTPVKYFHFLLDRQAYLQSKCELFNQTLKLGNHQ